MDKCAKTSVRAFPPSVRCATAISKSGRHIIGLLPWHICTGKALIHKRIAARAPSRHALHCASGAVLAPCNSNACSQPLASSALSREIEAAATGGSITRTPSLATQHCHSPAHVAPIKHTAGLMPSTSSCLPLPRLGRGGEQHLTRSSSHWLPVPLSPAVQETEPPHLPAPKGGGGQFTSNKLSNLAQAGRDWLEFPRSQRFRLDCFQQTFITRQA